MDVTRVATVMTPFPHHIDAREDLSTAHAMMHQHGIRHLPVMRDGELAGIVSERELEVAMAVTGERDPEARLPVWAICHRNPRQVELETSLIEVAEMIANEQIGSVLVTRKGKLAGIITTVDICRAFAELLRSKSPPDVVA